jgi:hypothetical protein
VCNGMSAAPLFYLTYPGSNCRNSTSCVKKTTSAHIGPSGRVKNVSLGGFGFRTVLHMPMDEGTGMGRTVISVSGTFVQTGVRD